MKKYVVVKHNLMRNQKFYKIHKTKDSWSVDREQAHKYSAKWAAAKIVLAKTANLADCWKGIIEYHVEEVE